MWRPLIDDDAKRAHVQRTVTDITKELEAKPSATPFEAADHAVLRSYLAADIIFPDAHDVAGRKLAEAIKRFAGDPALGLFGGGCRIGWTLAHLASREVAGDACDRLDHMLEQALAGWIGDYDLSNGLVGFGVYALERGEAGRPIALRVLDHLDRLATVHGGGIAWHTAPELLPENHLEVAPDGYWNLGLAHGVPGVIALLARFVGAGIDVARSRALLDGAIRFLMAAAPPSTNLHGRYPTWLPSDKPASPRLAWCYGDLGVATALLGASIHANEPTWRTQALALARACAARTLEQAAIHDAGICHGAAGVAHLFHRMARATGDATLMQAARAWIDEVLRMRSDTGLGGYARVYEQAGELQFDDDATLLTGAVGTALVLHAAISGLEPAWDRLLLVDLPATT